MSLARKSSAYWPRPISRSHPSISSVVSSSRQPRPRWAAWLGPPALPGLFAPPYCISCRVARLEGRTTWPHLGRAASEDGWFAPP